MVTPRAGERRKTLFEPLTRLRNDFPGELRLPLIEASDASKRAVDKALEHAGLI